MCVYILVCPLALKVVIVRFERDKRFTVCVWVMTSHHR